MAKATMLFVYAQKNHRKYTKPKNPILACKLFHPYDFDFQRDAKFTLIEKLTQLATTEHLRLRKLMYSEAKNISSILL